MLKEEKTLNEISSAYGIHVNQLRNGIKLLWISYPQLLIHLLKRPTR
ncbi:hypothetical protein [Alkalihalobacillus alcalophilus]